MHIQSIREHVRDQTKTGGLKQKHIVTVYSNYFCFKKIAMKNVERHYRTYFSFGEKSTISGTICEEAGASEVSKILIGFLTPE